MQKYKSKLFITTIVLSSIFLILIGRLTYLQILRGDDFEKFSLENRIRLISTLAPRGKILDRNGKEIVVNRHSFDITVLPNEVESVDQLSKKLSEILEIDPGIIKNKINKSIKQNLYTPIVISNDIDRDTLALIEARKAYLKGVTVEIKYLREYPNGKLASVVNGYLGRADKNDIKNFALTEINFLVGKAGIERKFENVLSGVNGVKYRIIDALGREVKSDLFKNDVKNKTVQAGNNIYLTIDSEIQKVAEESLGENLGSITVVEVNTGEILALASIPSYDPYLFVNGIDKKDWDSLVNNIYHPMLNRATQGTYAPGSTLKIVTALAALNENVIDSNTRVKCRGYYKVGKKRFKCWKSSGHGWMDLHRAIARSCDVFFYNTAEKLGIDKLAEYIKIFGFGEKTGIEISENSGVAPSKEWKRKKLNKPWYPGETVITSIGQGYLSTTPLQIALMTAAVANGGNLLKPIIVKTINSNNGENQKAFTTEVIGKLPFSKYHMDIVREALVAVVNEKYGNARRARIKDAFVAGKTGTSQVISLKTKSDSFFHRDHAWFTSYFPAEDPKIAVTVLVEHGGKGGQVAAPIAKQVIQKYIDINKPKEEKK